MQAADSLAILKAYWIFIVPLAVAGICCIVATRNFIRVLIGLEIMAKAATLLIIASGYASGRLALAQALVVTLIVVEVVVISVASGIVLGIYRRNDSLDIRKSRDMKG